MIDVIPPPKDKDGVPIESETCLLAPPNLEVRSSSTPRAATCLATYISAIFAA